MNFEFREGLIRIPVTIVYEGNQIAVDKCILDTGSATTAIDIDFVNFNYKKPAKIRRLCGIGGGTQEVITQQTDKFIINGVEFDNIEIEFGRIKTNFGIHGFIGNDILSRFILSINYRTYKIDLILHRMKRKFTVK